MRPQSVVPQQVQPTAGRVEHRSLAGIVAAVSAVMSILAYGLLHQPATTPVVMVALATAVVLLLSAVRLSTGRFDTLPFVFVGFHGVYMLAGPLSVLAGARLPSQFADPPDVRGYLSYYALATAGLACAWTASRAFGDSRASQHSPSSLSTSWLAGVGVLYSVVSLAGEWINLSRGGGVALLLEGKATVQSRVEELSLTVPTEFSATVAVGLLVWALRLSASGVGAGRVRRRVLFGLLCLTPVLLAWAFLGQRIAVAGLALAALLAWRWTEPVVRVRPRHLALLLAAYMFLGTIYALRAVVGIAISTGDLQLLRERMLSREIVVQTLNPGTNEFGVTLGNVTAFEDRRIWPRQYGMTYLKGVLLPIPGFLYPGDKPKQASYEFRDLFFPEEGKSGSIAGTGFSSVLEAVVNFGSAGVIGVYLCLGLLLFRLERMHRGGPGSLAALLYLVLAPKAILFHRSAFADAVIAPLVLGTLVCMPIIVLGMLQRGLKR